MFRRIGTLVATTVLVFLMVGPASAAKPEPSWDFVDIASSAEALGINDKNQVVGWIGNHYAEAHAFLWDTRVGLIDLHEAAGLSPDTFSAAHDINNQGTVVGWRMGDYDTLAWSERDGLFDISPGFQSADATAVNSKGEIVGGMHGVGFLWDARSGFEQLETLPGCRVPEANDINARGQIAGRCGTHAAIWHPDGQVQDLGSLGGDWVLVTGINNRGQVVGSWFGFQLYNRGFLWDPHDGVVDLGEFFMPQAINDSGQIVGRQGLHPAVRDTDGTVHLLPIPEGFVAGREGPRDINNRGAIIGQIPHLDPYSEHAVMWLPRR